jgi:hypothetical protein
MTALTLYGRLNPLIPNGLLHTARPASGQSDALTDHARPRIGSLTACQLNAQGPQAAVSPNQARVMAWRTSSIGLHNRSWRALQRTDRAAIDDLGEAEHVRASGDFSAPNPAFPVGASFESRG